MSLFGPTTSRPDPHGKTPSESERRAVIRRTESDISILQSDRMKLSRRKSDRELQLRKFRDELRRVQVSIERLEKDAKSDEGALRELEEEIRLAKKRLSTL